VSVGEVPNVPNLFVDGPINMAPLKKKKIVPECEQTHDLINTNHTMTSIIMATSTTTLLSVQKMMKKNR